MPGDTYEYQCKNGMVVMGKNPVAVEQQRKQVRNKRNKEKSKIYENELKINKTIWEQEYKKMKPVKDFDSKFIKVFRLPLSIVFSLARQQVFTWPNRILT